MEKQDVLRALEEGRLGDEVDKVEHINDLHAMHQLLFAHALESGFPRAELIRRIDEGTYAVARDSMLDVNELRLMNRKMLENFDPKLALDVYRAQIHVMIDACTEARAQERMPTNPTDG
jgi:hypothetical protein